MLKLVAEERHQRGLPDVTRPVFVCDHCGEEIKEAPRHSPERAKALVFEEGLKVLDTAMYG